MPTVTIDGVEAKVEMEATILEAARKAGIWIPTLCYNPALPHHAACRLCMVELVEGERRQLVTACNYPVRRDILVDTSGERAVRARQGVMELLLARAPESEQLKELAGRMGVKGTPYPKVTESEHNCILCGLCVNVCEEIMGCSAICFAGRGVERTVAAPFQLAAEDCIACGACAVVCPVGAIQVQIHEDTGEAEIFPFKARVKLLVCRECGARMVSVPVAGQMFDRLKIDWEEFRRRAELCPKCRRKTAAQGLGLVSAKSTTHSAENYKGVL